jgi:hypothetical protein
MKRDWYLLGPKVVGGTYWCGYWRKAYRVISINGDGTVTEADLAGPNAGVERTHCTSWDWDGGDRVLIGGVKQPVATYEVVLNGRVRTVWTDERFNLLVKQGRINSVFRGRRLR